MTEFNDTTSSELKLLVKSLLNKMENSPVLNGGFNKLQEEVGKVKEYQIQTHVDLGHVKSTVLDTKEKVEEIHTTLYSPKEGLFTRLVMVERDGEEIAKSLDDLEEHKDRHSKSSKEAETKLIKVEEQLKSLQAVTGEDWDNLRSLVAFNKNFTKIKWAVGLAFLAAFGKAMWDLVVHVQKLLVD